MPNLSQYPSPPGNKNQVVATVAGPASYTQVSTGSPPTGGFVITAQSVGMVSFDYFYGGTSDDGQYGLRPVFDNNPATDASQVRCLCYVLNTGAQVTGATNLSTRTFRFSAFGW